MIATTHDLKFGSTSDLASEADASGTHDAAVSIEDDQVGNVFLWLDVPLFDKSVLSSAVRIAVILKTTLACLITHWTVQRVVDQEQFHDVLAVFENLAAVGDQNGSIADRCLTAGSQTREHLDFAGRIFATDLDLAHTTVGYNR